MSTNNVGSISSNEKINGSYSRMAVDTSDINLRVDRDPVPLSLQSMITQTDKNGNPINISSTSTEDKPQPQRKSFIKRLLCCFQRRQQDDDHIPATNNYELRTRSFHSVSVPMSSPPMQFHRPLPAKMPNMEDLPKSQSWKKTLALDLDETLVHSSFQPVNKAHYVIPVNIDGTIHNVFVIKRPGVDDFLLRVSQHYEILVFTASLSKYADPLLDKLDVHKVISKRLFRENCVFHEGHYVKDLSLLNRDISKTIIVDNSPMSYKFHPENAIDCSSFIDDFSDVEMWQIGDFLTGIKDCDDVRKYCRLWRQWCRSHASTSPKK